MKNWWDDYFYNLNSKTTNKDIDSLLDSYNVYELLKLFPDHLSENILYKNIAREKNIKKVENYTTSKKKYNFTHIKLSPEFLWENIYGEKPKKIVLVAERRLNNVYLVFSDRNKFILKICHSPLLKEKELAFSSFEKEVWISKLLHQETQIPIPQIINEGNYEGNYFIVMSQLPGVPIDSIFWSTTDENRKKIINNIFSMLNEVHSIELPSAGFLSRIQKSVGFSSLKSYYLELINKYYQTASNEYKMIAFTQLYKLANNKLDFKNRPIALLHGDLGVRAGNILIDSKTFEITGVIDFEQARAGDPLEEYCRFYLELWKSWLKEMMKMYKSKSNIPDQFASAFARIHNLFINNMDPEFIYFYMNMASLIPGKQYLRPYSY